MTKKQQYKIIHSYLNEEKTIGAIKSMSYNSPALYELLLKGAEAKSGIYEKIMIDFTVRGQQVTVYNHDSKVTFNTVYDESLSYVGNVLSIFRDYAITEYLVDYENDEKAYFELIKTKG